MDKLQAVLDSVIFAEKFPPPNLSGNQTAQHLHNLFWNDSYNRNLRLEHVEIEMRLGRCPQRQHGAFNTTIPCHQFDKMVHTLQTYAAWDAVSFTSDIVGYFPHIDQSLRTVVSQDGTSTTCSKQKVQNADFKCHDLPFDIRLAVNIELPIPDDPQYNLQRATRVVTRERNSFTLGNIRYDLTRVTEGGTVSHQVELELINLPHLQMTTANSQQVTLEIQHRLVDIMNAVEPVRSFHISLHRKRNF